jgi:hypothetical protein
MLWPGCWSPLCRCTGCKLTERLMSQVIGGLVLNLERRRRQNGCSSQFAPLQVTCTIGNKVLRDDAVSALDAHHPFGTDPVFNHRSRLYNSMLSGSIGDYYNVSSGATEVAATGLPYAFFTRRLHGHPLGFPVVFQARCLAKDPPVL